MKNNSSFKNFYAYFIFIVLVILPTSAHTQTFSYTLDSGFDVNQNVNEPGLLSVKGNLSKPFTADDVKLSIIYRDNAGNWVTGWCKKLYRYNQYNEIVDAKFELPPSTQSSRSVKILLSSNTNLSNWNLISWEKVVTHFKQADYALSTCDLDENEYTILLTPKKESTLIKDTNGLVTGVKDRVTAANYWNRLADVKMDNKKNDVVFATKYPSQLISDTNGAKSLKLVNSGAINDTIAATPQFIYNEGTGHPLPYLYSYDDPVYIFAGKFSVNGFFIKFSQWYGDTSGPGYHNFKNTNALQSRYFNLYNSINQKLSDLISDQEPVVFVSSATTGFRVYKSNDSYITLTGTSNYGNMLFGYGNDQAKGRRGPGSENFQVSNTSEMTIYGMGALRNNVTSTYQSIRSIEDIDKEINKFIRYTGIFGTSPGYDDTSECTQNCYTVNPNAVSDATIVDWTKAPNSYIFTGKNKNGQSVDGLYIPVKKAYAMWLQGKYLDNAPIPNGIVSADVLWEDNIGLIKSGENYSLEIIGTGENAKIKVPISNIKEGNAVISFKVDGTIYWSWHIWATDDPTNGSTYKSYDDIKRQLADGTIENIPDNEWRWMDRNLGAIGSSLTGDGWNKNGGLLYQWGRKDPIPPLVTKGNGYYEINGSIGKVLHRNAHSQTAGYTKIDDFVKYINLSNADITNNLKLSIRNPLSLIYVNQDGTNVQAYYNNANGVYSDVNWFGSVSGIQTFELSKVNLWSDNSMGVVDANTVQNYNDASSAKPYRNKSSYDPCPNGWRIPSVFVAHATNNVRVDYSPFGIKANVPNYSIYTSGSGNSNIKPGINTLPGFLKGIKLYPQFGFDMRNVNGNNMGIFPGTGLIDRRSHAGQYSDQHESYLWTATMTMWDSSNLPWSTTARAMRLTPDQQQIINNYRPDATNYPIVYGLYNYLPLTGLSTNAALGCRCIQDPLYISNNYDFPTDYFNESENYFVGIDNPNSYLVVKSFETQTITIPVSKAFSVQSNFLDNKTILNPSSYNDLKTNVLWSDNLNLISQLSLDNAASKEGNIKVKINPNQAGNAVITLHNGSIKNSIYWSWHIWVVNNTVKSFTYVNDSPISTDNYVNYTQYGNIMKTIIMDRNLGATDPFPTVINPSAPTTQENTLMNNSQGLHFQWGRKDPIPTFLNISGTTYNIYLGTTDNSGNVTYTTLGSAAYNSTYPVSYNTYKNSFSTNDKIDNRISKIVKYSVENPLAFMKPATYFTPSPSSTNPIYTNGADWLFDNEHSNLFAERWGWGTTKSVFDPCPEGWRIPETISGAVDKGTKKNSPWSFKNNDELINTGIAATEAGYYGTAVGGFGATKGFIFNNSLYNVGNFPKGTIRGQRSVQYYNFDINHDLSLYNSKSLSGVWYANLSTGFYGRGNYLGFDRFGRMQISNNDIDPYAAMNCRCVKQQDDNGTERGPIPTLPVTPNTGVQAKNIFSQDIVLQKETNESTIFYPNPVKDVLNINSNENKIFYYQIYNMAGQKIHDGKFENKQTNLSFLIPGVYMIRINDSNQLVKFIKS